MQVATAIARYCPLLLESDILSLSPSFRLHARKAALEDIALGIWHPVHAQAYTTLHALTTNISVAELRNIAATQHVEELQLTELLGLLNVIGALTRRRAVRMWPIALLRQCAHLLMGVVYSLYTWRRPDTPTNVMVGVMRASFPVHVATLLVGGLMIGSGIVPTGTGLLAIGFGLATFLASIFLHELAHTIIIRRGGAEAVVLQRGMRLGILHSTQEPQIEIHSALIGPVIGLATGVTAGLWGYMLSPLFGLLGCMIGAFHLCGLLPWYGDGVSLRRALQQRRLHA